MKYHQDHIDSVRVEQMNRENAGMHGAMPVSREQRNMEDLKKSMPEHDCK